MARSTRFLAPTTFWLSLTDSPTKHQPTTNKEHYGSKTIGIRRGRSSGALEGRPKTGKSRRSDLGTQGPQRRARQKIRLAHRHQGRRDRREGNRTGGRL